MWRFVHYLHNIYTLMACRKVVVVIHKAQMDITKMNNILLFGGNS